MVRIVVDALGGDHAPKEIVKGAVLATQTDGVEVILTGPEQLINKELSLYKSVKNISVVNAVDVIQMSESPVQAMKRKKNSSIHVGLNLVSEGKADAFVSAGNTGAVMAVALMNLGRIEGIERPAIIATFPTVTGVSTIIDVGANVDCRPKHLIQFAQMGSIFTEHILHIKNPRVSLLNIGEEPEKGNELAVETYRLLGQTNLNFIGNIEGQDILLGKTDVIVCDGFLGNMILKSSEGFVIAIFNFIKTAVKGSLISMLGAVLMKPALKKLKKKIEYDEYGAAPLLGVNGVCMIAHGSAEAKAIKNAIFEAKITVLNGMVEKIKNIAKQGIIG